MNHLKVLSTESILVHVDFYIFTCKHQSIFFFQAPEAEMMVKEMLYLQ